MSKFRKRPVVIEAEQWLGPESKIDGVQPHIALLEHEPDYWFVETLEGPLKVSSGDWIIMGVKGEKYPCKPDVFEATYERVEECTGPNADARECPTHRRDTLPRPLAIVEDRTRARRVADGDARRRLKACVDRWPECESDKYDPRCCRFPKACMCDVYLEGIEDEKLEPV